MAMKKRQVSNKKPAVSRDDVITKATYALVVFMISLLTLSKVAPYYAFMDYILVIRPVLYGIMIGGAVAAVLTGCVWLCFRRKKSANLSYALVALATLFAVFAGSSWVLYYTMSNYVTLLYVAYVCALALYLIYLLYPLDFALISLVNAVAIATFYGLSKSFYGIPLTVIMIVTLVACGLVVFLSSRNHGKIGKTQLFSTNFSPVLFYGNAIIWALCLVASLLLGTLFAYYAIFAVGAIQLLFAVYYTVKLS